ncbi:hypothetical protein K1W54_18060 [Micromonospora sp. CPCC 205371]|nr:hypothetical protein [Micromonospora sp. CPCC 205371]
MRSPLIDAILLDRRPAASGARPAASIKLARDVEQLPERIRKLPSEQRVRETVAELNSRITDYHARPTHPFVSVRRVDPDEMAAAWRAANPV